jgi:hypothetical protein
VSSSRYGSGQVYVKSDSCYARWRLADGRHVNRKLGPVRARSSRDGLTRKQDEQRLRALIDKPAPAVESDGIEKTRMWLSTVSMLEGLLLRA